MGPNKERSALQAIRNLRIVKAHGRTAGKRMGLSQAEFATKFGLPPATLRNWEQGRARPDAPTRVLLAVIAKHPEAVEDVLLVGPDGFEPSTNGL